MLTFEEARDRVLSAAPRLEHERVALDAALGRVLAEELVASTDRPAFDYSAMDGYVLATGDVPSGEGDFRLRIVGESRTGGVIPARVEPGTACRIFTGAEVPPRGDAVVMQEVVEREGDVGVFRKRPRVGEHIRKAGEDLAAGARALPRGVRLGPAHMALIASLDRSRVTVARRPIVAIVSTGDELRDPGEPDRRGSVVDSNGPALAALVRACGGEPRRLPFARDTLPDVRDALRDALAFADVVLTIGGVSVGDHDVVRPALAEIGVELDFWKVAIKPGKPLVVGHAGARRLLGLPGNPASAMLTFVLFGAPLLRAMQGDAAPVPTMQLARLATTVNHATGRLEFLRATLASDGTGWIATPLGNQASGAVTSFAWADGLILVPADVATLEAGATVRVLRLGDV